MANPYKIGDQARVISMTAYGADYTRDVGTVCRILSTRLTRYCVWLKFERDPHNYDWPFALDEIEPHSPNHSPNQGSAENV